MSYDYSRLFDRLLDAVRSANSPQEQMLCVIAECESQRPHPDWAQLKKLDFTEELVSAHSWLARALAEASESEKYEGLWFGLFNPVYDELPTADIYVAASPEFVAGDIDWACNSTFYPEARCLGSKTLDAIYRIAYRSNDGLGNNAEYPLVLAYGAILARHALEQMNLRKPFDSLAGAAVGFDSGDFLFLGNFDSGKFTADIQAG